MENFKNMPIEELNISVRSYNCLKRHGVSTVGDLSAMTKEELIIIMFPKMIIILILVLIDMSIIKKE
mgnify:CR=1 FL=1